MLVADDQSDVVDALRILLKNAGFEVLTAGSPEAVVSTVATRDLDCVLMDLNYTRDTTSGSEGLDLLRNLGNQDPHLPVVVMTGWGSVDGAVEAMRRGARDYIEKPWNNDRLLATLATQVEFGRTKRHGERLAGANRRTAAGMEDFIAESAAMKPVLDLMAKVGPSDANVLICGEHGTGKDVAARWLYKVSGRSGESFVPVNAGGFGEGVFESEILGHVRGAFTDAKNDRAGCFELADRGTLFLDEIANVPYRQQAVLLRVLETGEIRRVGSAKMQRVDVRVLSATNADIGAAVACGEFREDLLYRLNTVEIRLPTLRDRREDIPILARHFLTRESRRYDKRIDGFEDDALRALLGHSWPGNVRELMHAVERAVLVASGWKITAEDLALRPVVAGQESLATMTLREAEGLLVEKALVRHAGNVTRAAEELGVSRAALYRKMKRHGL